MNGLGRFMAMQALSGDADRQDAEEAWRALHRRPDALPVSDDEPEIVANHRARRREALTVRRLMTRFGHR
jgi:hypothetical protein